jgi:hypothetical protein
MGKFLLLKYWLLVIFVSALASVGYAANKVFTGPGNFSDATKWNNGTLPAANDQLRIDGLCIFDNAAANLVYGNLTVGQGVAGTLQWPAGGTNTLNVRGVSSNVGGSSIDMANGGTLVIRAGWDPTNMTFTPGTGTINWNTTAINTPLPAAITTYNNLIISCTGRITNLSTATTLTGTLTISSGTLNLNNFNLFIAGDFINNAAFTPGTGTVTMNGTVAQSISGSVSTAFSGLTIANTAAAVSAPINLSASGVLTINANAIFTPAAAVVVSGTGTLTGNGTAMVTRTAAAPDFLSQYTIAAKVLAGLTVNYAGTGNQNVNLLNYGSLTITATSNRTVTFPAGTVGISGIFTPATASTTYVLTGNTIDFNGTGAQIIPVFNYNNLTSSSTGARTLPSTGTIGISGAFTPGTNAYTTTGSTVNFNGTGGQTIPAFNYHNLTSSSTGARTLSSIGIIGVANVLTLGTNSYTVTGSTVDFNGTASQSIPAFNYFNLTSSSTGARTLPSTGTVGIAGAFTPGTNAYTITGSTINYNGTGAQTISAFNYHNLTSSSTGARTLAPAGIIGVANVLTLGTNSYTVTGSTVNFNGTVSQNIPIFNFFNLTSSSTGGRLLPAGVVGIAGAFTPGTNAYTITGNTIDFNGTGAQTIPAFNYNNLTSSSTGARTLASAGTIGIAAAFTPGTNAYTVTGSTVNFNGTGAQTIPVFNYFNLVSSSTGARTLSSLGVIGVAGAFTPGTNAYTVTGSTIDFNGTGAQTIPAFNYNNLTSSSTGARTLASSGTIGISGTFTPGTNTYTITGSTVNFNGSAAQTIPAFNFHNLTSSSTGARTLSSIGTIGVANVLTLGTNSYTVTGSTVNFNGTVSQTIPAFNYFNLTSSSTGARTLASTGTIGIAGAFTPGTNAYTITGSTINYNGTGAQNIAVFNYNHLTLSTGGTKTFGTGTTGIAGAFTITAPATADATTQLSTINYNGTVAQNVACITYHHLTISGSNTKSLTCSAAIAGNLQISSGTFDVTAANFTIDLSGNWTNTGGTFNPRNGIVNLIGTSAQTITKAAGESFYNILIAGSGPINLGGPITVSNDLGINSTLDVSASNYTINLGRNWANNGTFIAQQGTLVLNGSTAQVLGGSSVTTFRNITLSNSAGASITNSQNLTGILTISAGTFTTTGQTFTLISDASGTARIAAIPAGGNINGNITMQRYITGSTDWRMLGSAVSGQTLAEWQDDFAMSGFPGSLDPAMPFVSVYTYDETQTGIKDIGWVAATDISNQITPGKGYFVYIGPNPVTVDITGAPNKFAQSFSLSYTPNAGALDDGWCMVANPYPSSIDWNASGWTKTNVNNAVYVWNSAAQQYASYVSGFGTNGGSNIIPSSQAFWVQANAASPAISMTETVKSLTDQAFLRSASMQQGEYVFKLKVSGNSYSDEAVIRFDPAATTGFDGGLDAQKFYSFNPNVPSIATAPDSIDYSINSLPPLTANISIPVRVMVGVSGTYTISDSLVAMPLSSCLVLEDLLTGTMTDLRTSNYTFTISDTTQYPRFLIHVGRPIDKSSVLALCSNTADGIAIATGIGTGPMNYLWTDASGDTLQYNMNISSADSLQNIPAGIYNVTITGNSGQCGTLSDTIEVQSPSPITFSAAATGESCAGSADGAVVMNSVNGGTAPFSYLWSNGLTSASVGGLAPGTYTVVITDDNGCTASGTVNIDPGVPVTAGFAMNADTVFLSSGANVILTNTSSGAATYEWDFGDGSPTDTTASTSHSYGFAGTYTVMLIAANGACTDTGYSQIVVINDYVDIPEHTGSLSIALMQSQSAVYISFTGAADNVKVSVYNSLGQVASAASYAHIDHSIERLQMPSAAAAGVYFVQVSSGSTHIVRKFVYEP